MDRADVVEAMTIAETSPLEIEQRAEIVAYTQHKKKRAAAGWHPHRGRSGERRNALKP
ncbi:MAG: hypothetical protein ACXVXN_02795 [Mycobacteriaceae bacterium]